MLSRPLQIYNLLLRITNSLDQDRTRPDLGPNCLQRPQKSPLLKQGKHFKFTSLDAG